MILWRIKNQMESQLMINESDHAVSLLQKLSKMRELQEQCNFVIRVGCMKIDVHRNVLMAASDYFKAMLCNQTAEIQTGIVDFKDCEPDCVKKCIEYIYTGKASISEDNIQSMMHVARMMQLGELCNSICDFAMKNLHSKTFFLFKTMANMYNCNVLENKCDMFALKHFTKIAQVSDFNKLDNDYLLYLISSNLCSASETFKCHVLLTWIEFDKTNRSQFFLSLLRNINIKQMDLAYVKFLLASEPLFAYAFSSECCTDGGMKQLVTVVAKNFEDLDVESEELVLFEKEFLTKVNFHENNNVSSKMFITSGYEDFCSMCFSAISLNDDIYVLTPEKRFFRLCYSDNKSVWVGVQDTVFDHGQFVPLTTLSGEIFAASGSKIGKKFEKYNAACDEWTVLIKDQLVFCEGCALLALKGFIYSIGGKFANTFDCLNEVERYDPIEIQWNFVASMSERRMVPAAVEYEEKIFVLGGWRNRKRLSTVEFYDSILNIWTTMQSMLTPRYRFNAVGGMSSYDSVERFNTEFERWEKVMQHDDNDVNINSAVKINHRPRVLSKFFW